MNLLELTERRLSVLKCDVLHTPELAVRQAMIARSSFRERLGTPLWMPKIWGGRGATVGFP